MAKVMCPKSLRENILGKVGDAAQRSPLPAFVLNSPRYKVTVGSFYEIDHSKLPPRSPAQLRASRVAMVTAKTELNVTVRYPSSQSLDAYFGNSESVALRMKPYPELDDKFVMGPKLALEVLGRQIPSQEFARLWNSKSFWIVDCFQAEQFPSLLSVCHVGGASETNKPSKVGGCFSEHQSSRIKGWGFRRPVAYVRDSEPLNVSMEGIDQLSVKKEEIENQEMEIKEIARKSRKRKPSEPLHGAKKKIKHNLKPKPPIEPKAENLECKEIVPQSRKRKPGRPPCGAKKNIKQNPKLKPPIEPKAENLESKEGTYVDRWPVKRYEAAAMKLAEVLKANGVVYGNPISRFQLREEARSHIGDTGLLDHLLKHLAGKVVPGGNERLRRRCDSDGKMEYWLESADLADLRKQVGVQDPYWTPPPGWKPGDCLTSHDCICCQQVKLLKQELSSMTRQVETLQSKKVEQAIAVAVPEYTEFSGQMNGRNLMEIYESLLKRKSVMEEQLIQVSETLQGLEEDMKMLSDKTEAEAAEEKLLMITNSVSVPGEEMNEVSITGLGEQGKREKKSNGASVLKVNMKLKPCGQQDNMSSHALDNPADDLMALTPASASPVSTTTS